MTNDNYKYGWPWELNPEAFNFNPRYNENYRYMHMGIRATDANLEGHFRWWYHLFRETKPRLKARKAGYNRCLMHDKLDDGKLLITNYGEELVEYTLNTITFLSAESSAQNYRMNQLAPANWYCSCTNGIERWKPTFTSSGRRSKYNKAFEPGDTFIYLPEGRQWWLKGYRVPHTDKTTDLTKLAKLRLLQQEADSILGQYKDLQTAEGVSK